MEFFDTRTLSKDSLTRSTYWRYFVVQIKEKYMCIREKVSRSLLVFVLALTKTDYVKTCLDWYMCTVTLNWIKAPIQAIENHCRFLYRTWAGSDINKYEICLAWIDIKLLPIPQSSITAKWLNQNSQPKNRKMLSDCITTYFFLYLQDAWIIILLMTIVILQYSKSSCFHLNEFAGISQQQRNIGTIDHVIFDYIDVTTRLYAYKIKH